MGTIPVNNNERVLKIEAFLGLNENPDGDTKLRLGEASVCRNWRVTRDRNLQRRPGTKTLFTLGNKKISGMWFGNVQGKDILLAACSGHLWKLKEDGEYFETPEDLGELNTENRVNFFAYSNIVYILNGEEYYQYDNVAFKPVPGYRPLVVTSSSPSGEQATLLEGVNKLNGLRRMWFSPDGESNLFQLPEKDLVSIDYVKYTADDSYVPLYLYEKDRFNGTLLFSGREEFEGDGTTKTFEFESDQLFKARVEVDGVVPVKDYDYDKDETTVKFLEPPASGASIVATYNYTGEDAEKFDGTNANGQITRTKTFAFRKVTIDGKAAREGTITARSSRSQNTVTVIPATYISTLQAYNVNPFISSYYYYGEGSQWYYVTYIGGEQQLAPVTLSEAGISVSGTHQVGETLTIRLTDADYYCNSQRTQLSFKEQYPASVEIVLSAGASGETSDTFTGDGETTDFKLSEHTTISDVSVKVNNVTQSPEEPFTLDFENRTITLRDTPADGAEIILHEDITPVRGINTIEVGYTAAATFRSDVARMTNAELFLGSQDNAVFIYGDGSNKALYSGIDYWGQPRADYFPDLNEVAVADSNTPITGMIRHYSQLICFKSNSTYIIHFGMITTALGDNEYGFYVTPVNKMIGNAALGQVRLVLNSPYVLFGNDLYEWKNSGSYSSNLTLDERQAKRISDRIYSTLGSFNAADCYCYDDNDNQEYYICYDDKALVYGYAADAWYVYTGLNITVMCNTEDEVILGTVNGEIKVMSVLYMNDDGEPIDSYWQSGSMDMGKNYMRKIMSEIWISMKPEEASQVTVTVQTDKKSEYTEKTIKSSLSSFTHMNFGDFTFAVNRRPQVKKLKIKAKKFAFLKLVFRSQDLYTTATVLSADPKVRETGFVK